MGGKKGLMDKIKCPEIAKKAVFGLICASIYEDRTPIQTLCKVSINGNFLLPLWCIKKAVASFFEEVNSPAPAGEYYHKRDYQVKCDVYEKNSVKSLFSPEARAFYNKLSDKAKDKFDTNIKKTLEGFTGSWFKKLPGTDDLYEFSADVDNHFYRLFAFWDKRDKNNTLIICMHGIEKKTNKTPEAAKKTAERMKKDWFAVPI